MSKIILSDLFLNHAEEKSKRQGKEGWQGQQDGGTGGESSWSGDGGDQSVSLEAQTQRLKIGKETQDDDDDVFLEEAIKLAAAEKKELKAEEKASILLFP